MKVKYKNILVMNKTERMGSTLLSSLLLQPRLGAKMFSIDHSHKNSGLYNTPRVQVFSLENDPSYILIQYRMQQFLACSEGNTITDVCSSTFRDFWEHLYFTSFAEYDYLVIPTTPTNCGQTQTISMIKELFELKMRLPRIRILPNKASWPTPAKPIESQFKLIFDFVKEDDRVSINPNCFLPYLPILTYMDITQRTWDGVLNDESDYHQAISSAFGSGNFAAPPMGSQNVSIGMMARHTRRIFDGVFPHLDIGPAAVSAVSPIEER